MLNRFRYYWGKDKESIWLVAYRRKNAHESSILKDPKRPFRTVPMKKGFWAADPLAITYDGADYLFYEYYDCKKEKGLLACSQVTDEGLSEPRVILEEPFHLSFPFVFQWNDTFYMIPETGAVQQLILYKCINFPYQWKREKVLLENILASDTIVFANEDKLYLLVSVLRGGKATEAENRLYRYHPQVQEVEYCYTAENVGEAGVRNAGGLFFEGERRIRPGQNCVGDVYGKSLMFFEVEQADEASYRERITGEILPQEIVLDGVENHFEGIHTYSNSEHFEFIDLKKLVKMPVIKRIRNMMRVILTFVKRRVCWCH